MKVGTFTKNDNMTPEQKQLQELEEKKKQLQLELDAQEAEVIFAKGRVRAIEDAKRDMRKTVQRQKQRNEFILSVAKEWRNAKGVESDWIEIVESTKTYRTQPKLETRIRGYRHTWRGDEIIEEVPHFNVKYRGHLLIPVFENDRRNYAFTWRIRLEFGVLDKDRAYKNLTTLRKRLDEVVERSIAKSRNSERIGAILNQLRADMRAQVDSDSNVFSFQLKSEYSKFAVNNKKYTLHIVYRNQNAAIFSVTILHKDASDAKGYQLRLIKYSVHKVDEAIRERSTDDFAVALKLLG